MSEELVRRHEGRVTRLPLNRAQKANALSATLVEALIDAVDYACSDGTRLLIFRVLPSEHVTSQLHDLLVFIRSARSICKTLKEPDDHLAALEERGESMRRPLH